MKIAEFVILRSDRWLEIEVTVGGQCITAMCYFSVAQRRIDGSESRAPLTVLLKTTVSPLTQKLKKYILQTF